MLAEVESEHLMNDTYSSYTVPRVWLSTSLTGYNHLISTHALQYSINVSFPKEYKDLSTYDMMKLQTLINFYGR